MFVLHKDCIVLRDFDRNTDRDLAQVGTKSTVHALEPVPGIRDSRGISDNGASLIKNLEDVVVGEFCWFLLITNILVME